MKKSLALVTNLYYSAKGRAYYREDILLSELLRDTFRLVLVHPEDLDSIASCVDAILVRNTGPMIGHSALLKSLQTNSHQWPIFNDLAGKGDIRGKQHLLSLFSKGYPVIPTVDTVNDIEKLGKTSKYLIKPIDGCDSHGITILTKDEVEQLDPTGFVIQPMINFDYEVSFYFIGNEFQYAMNAPNPAKRWELEQYLPNKEDIQFATRFIDWNSCSRGIQRIDACRDQNGALLLMELEDYNPFLSLELLDQATRQKFIKKLTHAISSYKQSSLNT